MKLLTTLFAIQQASPTTKAFKSITTFQRINQHSLVHTLSQSNRRDRFQTVSMMSTSSDEQKNLVVDPFCFRQFEEYDASKSYGGTVFANTVAEFEQIVNSQYDESKLQDGYAPFCKHLFIENNFTTAQVNVLEITTENESLLRTKYEARNNKELPVLTRFFPKDLVLQSDTKLPVAKYLDLILYSREQIRKENAAMKKNKSYSPEQDNAPWGIVSIKAQDVDYEIPMTPITAMRNALGKEEGGSGVPLDRDSYLKAYEYWNTHATIS